MVAENTIAVNKITGEEVWVLNIIPYTYPANAIPLGELPEPVIEVRRPTQTSDGVKHLVERFNISEFETLEDSYTRKRERTRRERNEQLADQAELQQRIMQLKPTKPTYSFEQEPYEVQ